MKPCGPIERIAGRAIFCQPVRIDATIGDGAQFYVTDDFGNLARLPWPQSDCALYGLGYEAWVGVWRYARGQVL